MAELERSDLRNDPTSNDEAGPPRLVEELAELRRENARLRELLGLDQRTAVGHQESWSPTLALDSPEQVSVDKDASDGEKLALL